MSEPFDIPDFCRISQAQRHAAWERNPPKPPPPYVPPEMEQVRKEEKREKTQARVATMLARHAEKHQTAQKEERRRGWKITACGLTLWMTPAQYDRIERELPTERHREILRDLWGASRALYASKPQPPKPLAAKPPPAPARAKVAASKRRSPAKRSKRVRRKA